MAHVNWQWDISAAIKWSKLHSPESYWDQTQIKHSTGKHSGWWQPNEKLVRMRPGFRAQCGIIYFSHNTHKLSETTQQLQWSRKRTAPQVKPPNLWRNRTENPDRRLATNDLSTTVNLWQHGCHAEWTLDIAGSRSVGTSGMGEMPLKRHRKKKNNNRGADLPQALHQPVVQLGPALRTVGECRPPTWPHASPATWRGNCHSQSPGGPRRRKEACRERWSEGSWCCCQGSLGSDLW